MELDLADWRRVMSTNLDGVFLGTRQAMRAMKEGGGGCLDLPRGVWGLTVSAARRMFSL